MYDRSNMQRHSTYAYGQYPVQSSPKQYPTAHSTSSAFSASATPNEDWTKISDLAERRRIQNRIAQRNYRKKLKKRLEDLERRAGSSSASPEQSHEELVPPIPHSDESPALDITHQHRNASHFQRARTPEVLNQRYVLPSDDRGMFSQQFTRQLSTSPPPFASYTSAIPSRNETASYSYAPSYCGMPTSGLDSPMFSQYQPSLQQTYPQMTTPPVKQEFYGDDEMSPFSMSYASMAGVDVSSAAHSYQGMDAFTPPMSDSFNHSHPASPLEPIQYPHTPNSMPRTPPMQVYDWS